MQQPEGGNVICPACGADWAWEGERPPDCIRCGYVGLFDKGVITEGQRRWITRIWEAFGDSFTEPSYGIGYMGCVRMPVNGLVFVVDRVTNRVSVELATEMPRPDFKEMMQDAVDDGFSPEAAYEHVHGLVAGIWDNREGK